MKINTNPGAYLHTLHIGFEKYMPLRPFVSSRGMKPDIRATFWLVIVIASVLRFPCVSQILFRPPPTAMFVGERAKTRDMASRGEKAREAVRIYVFLALLTCNLTSVQGCFIVSHTSVCVCDQQRHQLNRILPMRGFSEYLFPSPETGLK